MQGTAQLEAPTANGDGQVLLLCWALSWTEAELRAQRDLNAKLQGTIARLEATVEDLAAMVQNHAHRLFGQKSERSPRAGSEQSATASVAPAVTAAEGEPSLLATEQPPAQAVAASGEDTAASASPSRRRGQQPGSRGHGRRVRPGLTQRVVLHALDPTQLACSNCGTPYEAMAEQFEDSRLLDLCMDLIEEVHRRQKYRKACSCPVSEQTPAFKVAPPVAKVKPKGLFTARSLAQICVDKYGLGLPLERIGKSLKFVGGAISSGTLDGALQHVDELLHPLYDAIRDKVRQSDRAHADETRSITYTAEDGRRMWWLWVVAAPTAVAYLLDPSRGAEVMQRFFGLDLLGLSGLQTAAARAWTLVVDCYSGYKALGPRIRRAYCWAHIRRRILEVARGYDQAHLEPWAEAWRKRIAKLYRLHDERWRAPPTSPAWQEADVLLRSHVRAMRRTLTRQLNSPKLHAATRIVLESMDTHWSGLTLFLDQPWLVLDNNLAERLLRLPVVCRKNFYLNGAEWSGDLGASLWSIFATLEIYHLNPVTYLTAYLAACAESGGRPLTPDALVRFLPWQLSEEDRKAWSAPLARSRPPTASDTADAPSPRAISA